MHNIPTEAEYGEYHIVDEFPFGRFIGRKILIDAIQSATYNFLSV